MRKIVIIICTVFLLSCSDEYKAEQLYKTALTKSNRTGEQSFELQNVIDLYPETVFADSAIAKLRMIRQVIAKETLERQRQDSIKLVLEAEQKALLRQQKIDDEAELSRLKQKFNYYEDDFTGIGWYKHKAIPAKVQQYSFDNTKYRRSSYVEIPVRSNGFIYIKSIYHSSEWIFHEQIAVKINDRLLYSETIPSYSDNNSREARGPGITETIHFLNSSDNGILKSIAESTSNEITIRQIGDKYHDIKLIPEEILAIKESYRLAELLKSMQQ